MVSAKLSLEVDRRRREAQPVTKRKAWRQARAKKQVKRRVEEGNALGRERLEEKLLELAKQDDEEGKWLPSTNKA